MIDNPELQVKILDWQKRYNIQDGDPAIALLELVQFMGGISSGNQVTTSVSQEPVAAKVSSEALADAMKGGMLPLTERLAFQAQELQTKLEAIDFDKFVKQIEGYHEGIDYCTKKLDVVKKETDSMVVKIEKLATKITPMTRGAMVTLMAGAGVVGYVLRVITNG